MTTKRERMYRRIRQHGENLLAIFHDAKEQDPVKLCKRLRIWEGRASRAATDYCNGVIESGHMDVEAAYIRARVADLLGIAANDKRVFINRDPRGYALKIRDEYAKDMNIHKDWGGYGILAPDLTND